MAVQRLQEGELACADVSEAVNISANVVVIALFSSGFASCIQDVLCLD